MIKRECGDCTKCCEGWLIGTVNNHNFYRGRRCFYLEKGCSIYSDRPDHPCKNFLCFWMREETLPMWMKPNLINTIIQKHEIEEFEYYEVTEAGSKLDSSVLNWILIWAIQNNKNLLYQIDGGVNRFGSQKFIEKKINN